MLATPNSCIKFLLVYVILITIKILRKTIILKTIRTLYLNRGENWFSNKTRFISIDQEAFSVILLNYVSLTFPHRNFPMMLKRQIAKYCIIFYMLFISTLTSTSIDTRIHIDIRYLYVFYIYIYMNERREKKQIFALYYVKQFYYCVWLNY
jgi:hypothetical protein